VKYICLVNNPRVPGREPADRRPEELLPLGAPALRILLALGSDRLHGYAVMQRLEEETGGREPMLPGTLYSTLGKMLEAGLVVEVEGDGPNDDGRRRYYRVTPFGREVARAEALRLERLVSLARKRRLLPAGRGGAGR
jgi:DNA-binding PadR family transcriptional regulator